MSMCVFAFHYNPFALLTICFTPVILKRRIHEPLVLRTHCFYLSSRSYQGIVGGLGHNEAKGDLEDEEKAH
jgi:hypothetical protein